MKTDKELAVEIVCAIIQSGAAFNHGNGKLGFTMGEVKELIKDYYHFLTSNLASPDNGSVE